MAVLHVLAAREGLVDDHAPNKTAREFFNVNEQTIRDWVNAEAREPGYAAHRLLYLRRSAQRGDAAYAADAADLRRKSLLLDVTTEPDE